MSRQCLSVSSDDSVLLFGYHKKLKTMKKKFFVLYKENAYNGARIEYYDNEKKFKSCLTPKRIIKIKNCFNINRRLYTKHDFVIVLSSKEGGFGIVLDSEEEMNSWLTNLLMLQSAEKINFDFPHFDYVWQVIIQKKGIAEQQGIFGSYHICLTNKSITFIKISQEKTSIGDKKTAKIEVLLTTIRRCGDSQCFFYMEIGRQSTLGPGELWMETEDSLTAQNMHSMILSKMTSLNEALAEPMRKRSSSATEASNLLYDRKSVQHFDKAINACQTAQNFSRDRCDSLPSRNRTSSECCNNSIKMTPISTIPRALTRQGNNSSPVAYSASEESVTAGDSEDNIAFLPYLLRSSDGVILEECVDESLNLDNTRKSCNYIDAGYITSNALFAIGTRSVELNSKNDMDNILKKHCIENKPDSYTDPDEQFQRPVRAYSVGNQTQVINELPGESTGNRVRAFSVGSRIKNSRPNLKTSPRFFNSTNLENNCPEITTKKSISVPMLTNKSFNSVEQMTDLMEIDFSKSLGITLKPPNQPQSKNVCQKFLNQIHFDCSNAMESISHKQSGNGYLEMRPIAVDSITSSCKRNDDIIHNKNQPLCSSQNNTIDNVMANSECQDDYELKAMCLKYSKDNVCCTKNTSKIDDMTTTSNVNEDYNINKKGELSADVKLYTSKNKQMFNEYATSSDNVLESSKLHSMTKSKITSKNLILKNYGLKYGESLSLNNELNYASLDLPLCSKDLKKRANVKESLSDTNIGNTKNEYAKINFDQPETSSFSIRKNIN